MHLSLNQLKFDSNHSISQCFSLDCNDDKCRNYVSDEWQVLSSVSWRFSKLSVMVFFKWYSSRILYYRVERWDWLEDVAGRWQVVTLDFQRLLRLSVWFIYCIVTAVPVVGTRKCWRFFFYAVSLSRPAKRTWNESMPWSVNLKLQSLKYPRVREKYREEEKKPMNVV